MSIIKLAISGWRNAEEVMSQIDLKNKIKGIKQNSINLNLEGNKINPGVRGEIPPSTMVQF
jgi:hypothetical protein